MDRRTTTRPLPTATASLVVAVMAALAGACAGDDGGGAPTTMPTTTMPATTMPATTDSATTAPATSTTSDAAATTSAPELDPGSGEGPTVVTETRDFRDYTVVVPSGLGDEPVPLVMMLHGYTASGVVQEAYFQLGPLAEERTFVLVYPDGTFDPFGNRFWNATAACCDFTGSGVDDVAHLLGIVDDVRDRYSIDADRIHLVGHSNGGFMSYRLACDHADLFASIVSLAGAMIDPDQCDPSEPVSVVQVHGTLDDVIAYDGGATPGGGAYPSAIGSVEFWARANGCGDAEEPGAAVLDLDAGIDGDDTTVTRFADCPPGVSVELWTIEAGRHVPPLADGFRTGVIDALLEHPRPESD